MKLNLIAVAYLVVLLAADVRFRLGVWGLVLAIVGYLAIVAALEAWPRIQTRLSRERRAAATFRETERCVDELKSILSAPAFQDEVDPEVRAAFWRIASRLDQTARIIRHDPDKHRFAETFHGSYARPIRDLGRHYATLSARRVASARAELGRTEAELPRVEKQLDDVFEAIHRGDVSWLKSINEMLELQDGEIR